MHLPMLDALLKQELYGVHTPCAALQLHPARELLVCFVYVNMFVLPVHGDTRSLIFNFAGRERLCCCDFAAIVCILFIIYS